MGRLAPVVILLMFIFSTFPAAHAAGKVTADPNAPDARSAASATETSDPRLDTKLTYEGGYKRLHDVIGELSKASGVAIGCGTNQSDWRVRDVPIVVCVRDLPLGRVLSALADSAHVKLAAEKPEAGRPVTDRTYRLFRTKKGQEEIDSPTRERLEAGLRLANWSWDALVAYGNMPDPGTGRMQTWLVGKILASLGPEGKARAFSGEPIKLRAKDSPQSALLKELCPLAWGDLGTRDGSGGQPTEQDAENSSFSVHVYQSEDFGNVDFGWIFAFPDVAPHITLLTPGSAAVTNRAIITSSAPWMRDGVWTAKTLATTKGLDLPPQPSDPDPLTLADPPPLAGTKALKTRRDWGSPLLQAKAKLELGSDKEKITFSDVLAALSKSSGLNIICEDFKSHKTNEYASVSVAFPPDASVADVLRKLDDTTWFFGEQEKLLVGRPKNWRSDHATLVPEDLLARLRKKLNGSGAELDDYMEVVRLTPGQVSRWIESREFHHLSVTGPTEEKPLWKLYAALNVDQKRLAESETGLPLGSLGSGWASDFLRREFREATSFVIDLSSEENPARERNKRVLGDSDAVAGAVLRLRGGRVAEPGGYSTFTPRTKVELEAPKVDASSKRHYWLELRGKSGEQPLALDACLLKAFPILSLAKEPRWITPSCGGTGISTSGDGSFTTVIEMKSTSGSVIILP